MAGSSRSPVQGLSSRGPCLLSMWPGHVHNTRDSPVSSLVTPLKQKNPFLELSLRWKGTRGGAGLSEVRPETTSFYRFSQVGTMRPREGKRFQSPGGSSLEQCAENDSKGQERMAPLRTDHHGLAVGTDGLSAPAQPGLGFCSLTGT